MNSLHVIFEQVVAIVQNSEQELLSTYALQLGVLPIFLLGTLAIVWHLKKRRKKEEMMMRDLTRDKLQEIRKSEVDMEGLLKSIHQAHELYKQLSSKCHPDIFINSDKHAVSELLFQEITKNKRNYVKLEELKIRAIEELDINLKK